jgi:hypothetical protein
MQMKVLFRFCGPFTSKFGDTPDLQQALQCRIFRPLNIAPPKTVKNMPKTEDPGAVFLGIPRDQTVTRGR